MKQTGTAYLLYTLGRDIFPDTTGNKVNANYLQLVKNLETCNKFAWGTATLPYLLDQLATASRLTSTNIGGNFTLLQVWIYDHFPILNLAKVFDKDVDYVDTEPTAARYAYEDSKKRNKKKLVESLRETLDCLGVDDVAFQPYENEDEEDEVVEDEDMPVGMYHGPLWYPGGYVIYDPRRVLRQLGCVQKVPLFDEKFRLLPKSGKGTKITTSSWEPKYDPDPTVEFWNNLDNHTLDVSKLTPLLDDPCEEDPGYMDWYNQISHPFIINKKR